MTTLLVRIMQCMCSDKAEVYHCPNFYECSVAKSEIVEGVDVIENESIRQKSHNITQWVTLDLEQMYSFDCSYVYLLVQQLKCSSPHAAPSL